jgi:hypothetical protein
MCTVLFSETSISIYGFRPTDALAGTVRLHKMTNLKLRADQHCDEHNDQPPATGNLGHNLLILLAI